MSTEIQIADLSRARQRLRLRGADRVAFLHGQCTNDIKRLRVGESCYAAFLTAKGKMRGDAHIICLADAFLLETSPGLAPSLEKFIITEDVTIEDVSAQYRQYLIVPVGSKPRSEAEWRGAQRHSADAPCLTPNQTALPSDAVTYRHPLGTGVLSPVALPVTLDAGALEVLRIEAGIPEWGVDMDENTIPVEAGLEKRAISYEKGCYIGQETIARIKTYGHVNRRLIQLKVESAEVPKSGEKILIGDREVGHVTSAVLSVTLGKPLALGYVRREFAMAGTKLKINEQTGEVIKLCGS